MRLELDVGNTRLKWRLVDAVTGVLHRGAALVNGFDLESEFGRLGLECVLVSSVADTGVTTRLLSTLSRLVARDKVFHAEVHSVMAGVRFAYSDVASLGVDRCMAMLAGYQKYPSGVCVIDCGSAITVDLVAAGGRHHGGYIVPGLELLKSALRVGTANVVVPDVLGEELEPGSDTASCVGNGINLILRSVVLEALRLARHRSIESWVFTGGDAELVQSLAGLEGRLIYPDLVFDGLVLAAEEARFLTIKE